MNPKERRRLLKLYNHLYKRVKILDLDRCAYCGDKRQCLDHVPPISLLPNLDIKRHLKRGYKFYLFPSCLECNKRLFNYPSNSYYERVMFLQGRYDKLADKFEVWKDSELNELGYTLRSYIMRSTNKAKYFSDKLVGVSNILDQMILDDFNEDLL